MTTPGVLSAPAVDPAGSHPALAGFREPVRAWFAASFAAPTRAQELGWPPILAGESALVVAPTGSGKTLAAFLAAIDRLMFDPVPEAAQRCRALYVSPLKALAVDVERNLRAPLVGVVRWAERLGHPAHQPEVAVRTGDTPARDRARFHRRPADILITTPESLYLLLTSGAREALRAVRWAIIDEVHALVGSKRGAHLALSLERLEEIVAAPLQRIGLSATLQPLDEAARFLGGFAEGTPEGARPSAAPRPRPVRIVDAAGPKTLDLTVEVAVEDMARLGEPLEVPSGPASQGEARASIWPAMHPLILDLIRRHRSTLIFVNSRRLAERLAGALNELAGETVVRTHHGSIAREQRLEVEEQLKAGRLPALVATSSLELGIDMGAIDLVIHVGAPPAVGSGLQRIGRAGHSIGLPSRGVILPRFRGELLACAALSERMRAAAVEPLRYPRNPLDVLAQQIVAMVAVEPWPVERLERVVRRAAPFADLPGGLLAEVLDMLAGRYPSDEFAELRPRLTWDRLGGTLRAREGAKRLAIANGGTIPDRGLYGVYLAGAEAGKGRVGELDEEMVFETRPGETFVLGASTWRVQEITHDRVLVSPAPGEPGRMPFWHGDAAGRTREFGRAVGALTRSLRALPAAEAMARLQGQHGLSESAARNLLRYLEDQVQAAGAVPDDRTIVVERYRDEMGDWRLCVLSPFGARVHGPWAMAIGAGIREARGYEADVLWTDDGIVVRLPEADEPPPAETVLPDPDDVERLVIQQLGMGGGARQAGQGAPATALFASRFREAAARALLLPRRIPGRRTPLWQQRRRAADLLHVAARHPSFPIVLETYRECLRDAFDIPALVGLLRQVRAREIRVVPVDTQVPSPFAAAVMFTYVANFLYEGDAPLAERRAQALTVDPTRLRELLGEAELRDLMDGAVLASLEMELQRLAPDRAARHADGLHDLLRHLGDLTRQELAGRAAPGADLDGWLAQLERERRVVTLPVAGEPRSVAAEDAGRYRDALGIPPPPGLPAAFLEPARDPLGDLVARYARTHGPFRAVEAARRLGIGAAPVEEALRRLEAAGRVMQGEFRPGGSGREWCDAGVLRALRQRSLARLRREVEPVEREALGRFYRAWQGVGARRSGPEALVEVVEQLQGAAIPASVLEAEVLPARLEPYDPRDLDALFASGTLMWAGAGRLGPRDGRVALYLTEHAPLLLDAETAERPDGPLHRALRDALGERGALFFPRLVQAAGGGFMPEILEALWDLVWAGEVTNDTLQPLRAWLSPHPARRAALRARRLRGPGRLAPPGGPLFAPRAVPPEAAGRWSLVRGLLGAPPSPTERLAARARQLLDRHGVLTREAAAAERPDGGFSALYGVFRAMEEAGRIRRGYFVAGCGAIQFALPGAVDRLRALRESTEGAAAIVLAAADPANPYGTALPWPGAAEGRRPTRAAGALVLLVGGALVAWMGPGERSLLTFTESLSPEDTQETLHAAAHALAAEVAPGRRRLLFIEEVDGRPARETPLGAALLEAGFTATPRGLLKRR